MRMYFDTTYHMKNILFEGLNTHSVKDIALISVVAFLLAIVFSGLSALKDIVTAKRHRNPLSESSMPCAASTLSMDDSNSQSGLLSSLRIPTNVGVIRRHRFKLFVLEALIHTFKLAYGYMLMLVVMTYNVWLGLAVVVGSGMGYFIFFPLTSHLSMLYSQPPRSRHGCADKEDSATGATGGQVREQVTMPPPPVNGGHREPLIHSDSSGHGMLRI